MKKQPESARNARKEPQKLIKPPEDSLDTDYVDITDLNSLDFHHARREQQLQRQKYEEIKNYKTLDYNRSANGDVRSDQGVRLKDFTKAAIFSIHAGHQTYSKSRRISLRNTANPQIHIMRLRCTLLR